MTRSEAIQDAHDILTENCEGYPMMEMARALTHEASLLEELVNRCIYISNGGKFCVLHAVRRGDMKPADTREEAMVALIENLGKNVTDSLTHG